MTTPTRIERSLPAILADLAAGPTPDYIEGVLSTTAQRRQRPTWTFPERWLPMADITSRQAVAPRLPSRMIAVALVILALIASAAAVYVGTHQTRLPAAFGPAANGQIPYASSGDIYLGDPVTGESRLLVKSPETESGAVTSPDGTQVAFARDVAGTTLADVFVVGIDGSSLHKVTPEPIDQLQWGAWTPDARHLALIHQVYPTEGDCPTVNCSVRRLDLVDAAGGGAVETIATADGMDFVQFRPPDGRELLYRARVDGKWGLFAMDVDGASARQIIAPTVPAEMDLSFGGAAYSADGSRIFYQHADADGCCRLWVVNADGSNDHEFLPLGPGWDGEAVPSPDGQWIAYWHNPNDGPAHGITVVRADGTGPTIDTGPTNGGHWIWAPDSSKILMFQNDVDSANAWLLDPTGGPYTTVPWGSNGDLDWQRLAPPD
jgi:Tol biopolymer transport system component